MRQTLQALCADRKCWVWVVVVPLLLRGRVVVLRNAMLRLLPTKLGTLQAVEVVLCATWWAATDAAGGELQVQPSPCFTRPAVSGFIAADTPIGPMWFAVGQSNSDTSVYIVLGRVF